MNRAETKARARDLWQEVTGSPTWGDELGIDAELDAAAEEVFGRKHVWYGSHFVSVVASARSVSLSALFILDRVFVGTRELSIRPYAQERRDNPSFKTAGLSSPSYAIRDGQTLWLYPGFSEAATVELEGFLNPRGRWPEETDENPGPLWCHEAVAACLAARRASLFPKMREEAAALMAAFERKARALEPLASAAYHDHKYR